MGLGGRRRSKESGSPCWDGGGESPGHLQGLDAD